MNYSSLTVMDYQFIIRISNWETRLQENNGSDCVPSIDKAPTCLLDREVTVPLVNRNFLRRSVAQVQIDIIDLHTKVYKHTETSVSTTFPVILRTGPNCRLQSYKHVILFWASHPVRPRSFPVTAVYASGIPCSRIICSVVFYL